MKLNLGCGHQIKEDYVNVDKFAMPGVDVVTDLFHFPWPFADESVEEIFCSHLIEHIPHQVYEATPVPLEIQRLHNKHMAVSLQPHIADLDGFFRFFQEVYRILQPQGTITCIAPYWSWMGAAWDPTHTRSICMETFSYLCPPDYNPNYDYHLPFRFAAVSLKYNLVAPTPGGEPLDFTPYEKYHNINTIQEIQAILQKVPMP